MALTSRLNVSWMREDMELRGWLQTDLARAAGVADTTVMRVFRGERQTARTVKKLAEALGYSVKRYVQRAGREAA